MINFKPLYSPLEAWAVITLLQVVQTCNGHIPNSDISGNEIVVCTSVSTVILECPEIENTSLLEKPITCYEQSSEENITCLNFAKEKNVQDKRSIYGFRYMYYPAPKTSIKNVMNFLGISKTRELRIAFSQNEHNFSATNLLSELQDVTILDLNGNDLSLTKDEISKMPNLTELYLAGNRIMLEKDTFEWNTQLNNLELGNNNLENLQPGVFKHLTNLRSLNIWGNKLKDLRRELFTDMPNLESLYAGSNLLKTLPKTVFADLRNLKIINLFNNLFENLPEGLFINNPRLEAVEIYDMKTLKSIPPKLLANLTALENVKLSKCNISFIPEDLIQGSINLKRIELDENSISEIPEQLFIDGKLLQYINLNRNNISLLPNDIFINNRNLQSLNLANNKITYIQRDVFSTLISLKELDLSSNKITAIDIDAFKNTKEITKLYLANNFLFTTEHGLRSTTFSTLYKLEILDLSNNFISTIPIAKIFKTSNVFLPEDIITFNSFQTLNLTRNNISELEISSITPLWYAGRNNNKIVDLSFNNISTIHFENAETIIRSEVYERIEVKLEGNPLNCDCQTYDLLQYFEGKEFSELKSKVIQLESNDLVCVMPENLKNRSISDVLPNQLKCKLENKPGNTSSESECDYSNRPHELVLEVECKNKRISEIPDLAKKIPWENFYYYTVELNLTGNFIKNLTKKSHQALKNVTILDLSFNNISQINLANLTSVIKVLKLHNNNISYLDDATIKFLNNEPLKEITLHNNPWICDCNAISLMQFMQTNYAKISTIDNITCSEGGPLIKKTIDDICPLYNIITIIYLIALPVSLVTATIVNLFYRYKTEIKIWCFTHRIFLSLVAEKTYEYNKTYDAFISYADEDAKFVMDELRKELEDKEPKYRLYIKDRDHDLCEPNMRSIENNISDSRRTVIVLSNNYIHKNTWGRVEFRTAHTKALQDNRARVIVILYGDTVKTDDLDSELKAYIITNTYLKWGQRSFWEKLRYYLPHRPYLMKNDQRNHAYTNSFQNEHCSFCCASRRVHNTIL